MRQVFVGDSARLVDQLVESSQIRPPVNSTYTGAGRELVPFFDLHEPVGNAALMGSLESTPTRKAGNAQRGSPRKASGGRSNANNIKPEPAAARGGSASPPQRRVGSPGRASPRKFTKAAPQAIAAVVPAPVFRCPGFAQSPKPELVPMPTFGLLQRAVARSLASSCKTSASSFGQAVSGMLPALQVAA